jgi:putative methyltransferase (TIGR04325 family)
VTGRSRFRPVDSWQEATDATSGYEALVDQADLTPAEWNTAWPVVTDRELQLLAGVGIVLARLGDTQTLRVLDFGGWSGVYSVAIRQAFPTLELNWTVVETPAVSHQFQHLPAPDWLSWEVTPDSAHGYDMVLASGSLNYVPDPIPTLQKLARLAPYLVVTRLPLWPIPAHLPAAQYVDRRAGLGYPTWFFSDAAFRQELATFATITVEWSVPQDTAYFGHHRCDYRGLILESSVFQRRLT